MPSKQIIKNRLLDTNVFNNDKYLNKYCEICSKNDTQTQYIEGHHIFPKSLSRFLKQDIDNSESNFAVLSYRNHIKAHIYLALACKDNEMFLKLEYAVRLCIQSNLINKTKTNLRKELLKDLIHINEFVLLKEKRYNKDKLFYNSCNACKSLRTHDKLNHLELGYSAHKYKDICDKYGWEHKFILIYTEQENKTFYDSVNQYSSISEYCRANDIISRRPTDRYIKICKRYGWENKFQHSWGLEQDKQFYDECNNCLSLSDHDRKYKLDNGYSLTRYSRICKRYKWPNKFIVAYTEQENKAFYDSVNCFSTLKSFAKANNLKEKYVQQRYLNCCKKYGWKNKFNLCYSKEEDIKFYNECNTCKTLEEHNLKFGYNRNYSQKRYAKICKKYGLEHRFRPKIFTKKDNLIFYNECNKFNTLKDYASANNKNYAAIAARYKNTCKKYHLKNKFFHNHPGSHKSHLKSNRF